MAREITLSRDQAELLVDLIEKEPIWTRLHAELMRDLRAAFGMGRHLVAEQFIADCLNES